jgi:hypothetical protein
MSCKSFPRWSHLAAAGLLLCAAAGAEETLSRRAPAVTRNLQSRYKMPDGYISPGGFGIPGVESAKGLSDLVNIERKIYPGACVTAGFYDFRTVSRYRSHPGLHLGYDIAMPAGSPAACGWPGTVTSVVTWSGEEHGITVVAPDGRQITYGHLSPRVKVGQALKAGDIVGVIVRDHVDVKMRDANGNYRDYGAGQGGIAAIGAPPMPKGAAAGTLYNTPAWINPDWFKPEASKEMLLTTWLVACNSRDLAKEEYTQLEHQAYLRKL